MKQSLEFSLLDIKKLQNQFLYYIMDNSYYAFLLFSVLTICEFMAFFQFIQLSELVGMKLFTILCFNVYRIYSDDSFFHLTWIICITFLFFCFPLLVWLEVYNFIELFKKPDFSFMDFLLLSVSYFIDICFHLYYFITS